ncbi:MAG: phage holin family protein [Verrucomicrobiota bacterium]
MNDSIPSPGLFGSLRRAGATLVSMAGNRLELMVVELQEERNRLLAVLALLLATAVFAGFALALVTGAVLYLLWSTHPLAALLGVALLYAGGATACVLRIQYLLRESQPFASTLAEFRKDQQCLQPQAPTTSDSGNSSSSSKAS